MGLIIRPPSWAHCTSNLGGAAPTITGGSAGVEGTPVALFSSAVTHDVEYLVIALWGDFIAATNSSGLFDILIDPAGGTSWDTTNPLISNLLVGFSNDIASGLWTPRMYHFPIWVKSGASFAGRVQYASSGLSVEAAIHVYGGSANPSTWWCGTHVESIGIDTGNSRGTTHTPGNSGTYSSWTNLGSTQSGTSGAVQFGFTGHLTAYNALQYFWQFGIGSQQVGPTMWEAMGTSEAGVQSPSGPIFYAAPSGTQWQVRATCSGTGQAHNAAIYVVH